LRILIAEDERDIRELIVFTLHEVAGFDVHEAVNGIDALEKVSQVMPDLVLMDVRMPKMNGYEACEKMKKDPALRDIPVVFLSAKGQESEIKTGLKMGAEAYILKPFSPDELIGQVEMIMKQVQARRAQSKAAD
jgi:two-component system alkaline phosphatase synthesis response regulator PhoP